MRQQDWLADGAGVAFDRQVVYDAAGRVSTETDVTRQGSDTFTSTVTNNYGSGTSYALGAVVSSSSTNLKNGSYQPGTSTTTAYDWYDGAVQRTVSYYNGSTTYTTGYAYTATGALVSAHVQDGRDIGVWRRAVRQGTRWSPPHRHRPQRIDGPLEDSGRDRVQNCGHETPIFQSHC
ncbi:hypothetical protein [Sphingomonas sp.]|uniref:hypothetical protein n=1 Tax=Sphingomonas sp. TaxID=28214 RepID=UPI0025D08167|nr:hypothetical protein [Sphingomonas sp.]